MSRHLLSFAIAFAVTFQREDGDDNDQSGTPVEPSSYLCCTKKLLAVLAPRHLSRFGRLDASRENLITPVCVEPRHFAVFARFARTVDLVRDLRMYLSGPDILAMIARACPILRSLFVKVNCPPNFAIEVDFSPLRSLRYLEELAFSKYDNPVTDAELTGIGEHALNLTALCLVQRLLPQSPLYKIRAGNEGEDAAMCGMLSKLRFLQELRMQDLLTQVTARAIASIPAARLLRVLDFRRSKVISGDALVAACSGANFCGMSGSFADETVEALGEKRAWPLLETLRAANCASLTDRACELLARHFTNLRSVFLYGPCKITGAGIALLAKLPLLRQIECSIESQDDVAPILGALRDAPCLECFANRTFTFEVEYAGVALRREIERSAQNVVASGSRRRSR